MIVTNIILDKDNHTIKFEGSTENNELVRQIWLDNQDTFVCMNDPSMCESTKIYELADDIDGWKQPLDTRNTPFNLEKDLLFCFIKYEVTNDDEEIEYKTMLIPCYDGTSLLNLIWKVIKDGFDPDCCGNISIVAKQVLVAKAGLEIALQLNKYRDAIKYWNILHSNTAIHKNCTCNG